MVVRIDSNTLFDDTNREGPEMLITANDEERGSGILQEAIYRAKTRKCPGTGEILIELLKSLDDKSVPLLQPFQPKRSK